MLQRTALAVLALFAILFFGTNASAHGIYGHMHVTGWAVENMPDSELKEFLSEPEVFEALLYGAAFTDAGYWIRSGAYEARARAFAEHNHWPPFIQDAVTWIRENNPPPFETLESKKRAAFVLGIASHGLQDEVFDSLFLYQIQEHDDAGQEEADPGTDGFLFLDDHVRLRPREYLPMDMLIELYSGLDEDVDQETIEQATGAMSAYLDEELGRSIGRSLGNDYEDEIPWARRHYLDPDIPGSLRAEIRPTMNHIRAVWQRMHGEWSDEALVVHTYPAIPRRLLSHDHQSPDSWVTFIFGRGIAYGKGQAALVDADGHAAAADRDDTRWGGSGDWTRLATLKPTADLEPGAYYTASLAGEIDMIGGASSQQDYSFEFQVACTDANEGECPEQQYDTPSIDGPDTGNGDAGSDTGTPDAGVPDTGGPDDEDAGATPGDETASESGCSTTESHPVALLPALALLTLICLRRGSWYRDT